MARRSEILTVYAAGLVQGVCETMNGNWAVPYMTKHFGASAFMASLALAIFWSMVTVGRILFAAIEKWLPEKTACRVLPFVIAVFGIVEELQSHAAGITAENNSAVALVGA